MTNETILTILTEAGGKLWEKYEKRRVYFNAGAIANVIGFQAEYYKTGNVSNATLGGIDISNSQARKIITELNTAKFWYDFSDDLFHFNTYAPDVTHLARAAAVLGDKLKTADISSEEKL